MLFSLFLAHPGVGLCLPQCLELLSHFPGSRHTWNAEAQQADVWKGRDIIIQLHIPEV